MDNNAKQCVQTCFFHMRKIRQLRQFPDDNTMHTLIRALVLSRLDYCNNLYAGCMISTLHRLQRVQDAAARLLCGASPRAHARPLLQQLHWLPAVTSRIQYKLCVLMFDIYHGTAPSYMLELCKRCTDSRLRSAAHGDFTIPRTCLRFTDRSFALTGPKACNALPSRLHTLTCKDTFRKNLKTHFFNHCFN